MSATGDADGRTKCRFDFAFVGLDEETRRVFAEPDPRRYERVEKDGEPFLLDKYLEVLVPFEEIIKGFDGLPTFASPRTINSAPDYALKRREAVVQEIETGQYSPPAEIPKHHEPFSAEVRDVAFLSVDICGATSRRAANPDAFDTSFRIFLRELGTLVGQFHGTLLKTTGDGFIAYVDLPAFTIETDTAVDLGLSIVLMVKDTINSALEKLGDPPMAVRVGIDYGRAKLENLWVAATEFTHADLVSDALNRAVKIEETCEPNEVRIGRSLYELLHVQWLERCNEVSFDWSQVGIEGYQVYRVE